MSHSCLFVPFGTWCADDTKQSPQPDCKGQGRLRDVLQMRVVLLSDSMELGHHLLPVQTGVSMRLPAASWCPGDRWPLTGGHSVPRVCTGSTAWLCMRRLRSIDGQSWRSPLTDNVGTAEHWVPSRETQVCTVSPRSHQRGKHRFRPNRCGSQRKGGLRTTKHQEKSISTLGPGKGFTVPPGGWGVGDHPRSAAAESELHKDAAVSSRLLGQCQPVLFKGHVIVFIKS